MVFDRSMQLSMSAFHFESDHTIINHQIPQPHQKTFSIVLTRYAVSPALALYWPARHIFQNAFMPFLLFMTLCHIQFYR
jgi:hypothetical protein